MTTNSLLRVIATALAFTAACKSDFQAGINGNDGSAQEVAVSHDSGSPADSVPWSCDPFSPITKPITLTNVLGAGRDTDGTLYVVDQPQPGGERVFVSSGGTLQRQRIDGSGTESSGGGVMSYTLFVSDHVPPLILKLENNAAGPTAMGVLQGTLADKTFTIGQQGSVLTLVPSAQVAGLPVANIPAETVIEYNATLSDGRALLVVRPRDDWTYQDFRVFFGSPDHMVERTVSQVVRYQDGGSTTINFTVDGVPAVASFPVSLTGVAAPPTLTIGATKYTLTLAPIASPPAEYSYFCLGNPPVDGGVDALSTPADGPATCRAPSPDYGPTTVFSSLPMDTPAAATTCPAACGNSAWRPDYGINIDIALPYGACAAGTPSCSALGAIPCACGASSGPVDGFNCSCEGETWICRIVYFGTALCSPCPDAGVGDGPNDAAPALQGSFVPAGNMTTVRYEHTATLLPSGKVLIAGGESSGPSVETGIIYVTAVTELYDPAAGTFAAGGAMTTVRYQHTATLLPGGKVLITGGLGNSPPVETTSAELYDPATGTFSATGSMTVARLFHTATLLGSGKVLLAGGMNDGGLGSLSEGPGAPVVTAELYDPATGTFATTGNMTAGMANHTATLLPNGKVLLVGGGNAQLYDAATGTFATTGTTPPLRYGHAAALLPSGQVLLTGGEIAGYESSLVSAELYDPKLGSFSPTGSMTLARYRPTATLLPSGQVLIVGGATYQASGTAELYDPTTGTFAPTGNLSVSRAEHTATLLPSGRVLVAGGVGYMSTYLASAELYE